MNLLKIGEDGDVSNYIPNSEWTLVRMHVNRSVVYYSCCEEPYPDITYTVQVTLPVVSVIHLVKYITYTVQMRRKPLFYVFNMIMPCFLITLVALLGFYVPSDSGEKVSMGLMTSRLLRLRIKVSMGITTLLSMTVFLMLVTENMPPTSDVLPLVGKRHSCRVLTALYATMYDNVCSEN